MLRAGAAICLIVCILLLLANARGRLSRIYYSSNDEEILSGDKAIRLTPNDPDAHYARASALAESDSFFPAVKEYELAAALRPRDHYLWLELGYARVQNKDDNGARIAYLNAVRLAPYYAQPHWRLGQFLLRTGEREEAFTEFRRANASDPALLSSLIKLAAQEYSGNAEAIQRAVQPQTASARLELARLFLHTGNISAAMDAFKGNSGTNDPERSQFIDDLLKAKRFVEAFEVWHSGRVEGSEDSNDSICKITDGGFEREINLSDVGFGWRGTGVHSEPSISLDANNPHTGMGSMRVDFNGNSEPAAAVISQLVIVEPNRSYRLIFAARTRELVTGGLPVIKITDASSAQLIGESSALSAGSTGWQTYTVEFSTNGTSQAVYISVQRRNCTTSPCPIFGQIWLDSFELSKL